MIRFDDEQRAFLARGGCIVAETDRYPIVMFWRVLAPSDGPATPLHQP